MPFLTQFKTSRSIQLLLAFLFTVGFAMHAVSGMTNTAGKLGALMPSTCLLGAGIWLSFKEGWWFAKTLAGAVLILTMCCFCGDLERAFEHQESSREIDPAMSDLRTSLIKDASQGNTSTDAAKQRLASMDAAAARMQSSTHAETVEFGQDLATLTELSRELNGAMLAALEPVQSDRFLSVRRMVNEDDFEWQHKAATDYLAAAKATAISNESFDDAAAKKLMASGASPASLRGILTGIRRVQPFNARSMQAHIRYALVSEKFIDFVELHEAEITVKEDGVVRLETRALLDEFKQLQQELKTARSAVNSTAEQLMKAAGGG